LTANRMSNFPWTRKPDFKGIQNLDYDSYWRERGFSIQKKLRPREVLVLDSIAGGSRVLDVGCGNSRLPIALKEKGCAVTVGDISSVVLEGFRQHGIDAIRVDLANFDGTGLEGHFDYLVLSEVLEHLANPEEALARLGKLADRIWITVPNSAFYRYRLHLMFSGRFFTQWVHHPSEHLRFWSHADFLDWLDALGYAVVEAKASNGPVWLKDVWPNLFGHQVCYLAKRK